MISSYSIALLTLPFRQDRLQRGYILLAQVLPWLHEKFAELDIDDCEDMKKKASDFNYEAFRAVH